MAKDVSIRELHEKTGQLIDAAAAGDVIIIKRRGKPVAELRRYAPKPKKLPDFDARTAKFPVFTAEHSTQFVEQDRDGE